MSHSPCADRPRLLFRRLWLGYGVSSFGDQVTLLALPLAAALTLHAGAAQMGALTAAGTLPQLLLSLPLGALADRRARRPLMVISDILRAATLLLAPLLALFGALSLLALDMVAFLAGAGAALGGIAANAFLPGLVGRGGVVTANSRLQATDAVARMTGPGLAGLLIQAVGAPYAVIVDALTFLFSAVVVLFGVRQPEPRPDARTPGSLRREVLAGLLFNLRVPTLRAIYGSAAVINLFGTAIQAVLVLYAVRTLGLSAGLLGIALGAGSAGALIGALLAARIARRFGLGPTAIAGIGLAVLGALPLALAHGTPPIAALIVGISEFLDGFGVLLFDVNISGIRPALTPDELLGRSAAASRTVSQGARPAGALLGGVLGAWFGLRGAIAIGAVGSLLPVGWLLLSPLRTLHALPTTEPLPAATL